MGYFLVQSPLALAVGAALAEVGQTVELDDAEAERLLANGTVVAAETAPPAEDGDEPPRKVAKGAKA